MVYVDLDFSVAAGFSEGDESVFHIWLSVFGLGVFGCEDDGCLECPVIEEEDFVGVFVSGFDYGFAVVDSGVFEDDVGMSWVIEEFEL